MGSKEDTDSGSEWESERSIRIKSLGGKRDSTWEGPRCLRESEEGCSDERRRNAGCLGCTAHRSGLDKVTQIEYMSLPALGPSPGDSQTWLTTTMPPPPSSWVTAHQELKAPYRLSSSLQPCRKVLMTSVYRWGNWESELLSKWSQVTPL